MSDNGLEDFSATTDNLLGFNVYENTNLTQDIGPYHLIYPSDADTTFFQRTMVGEPFSYGGINENLKNYAFPKAQILDFTENNRSENPFISRYFNNSNVQLLDRITSQNPSFFMLNLGYEDLLGFAINGGEGELEVVTLSNHTYRDLLEVGQFEQKLQFITDELRASGNNVKGVLINIPDFLKFPYFLKVGHDMRPYLVAHGIWPELIQLIRPFNNKLTDYYSDNPSIPFPDRRRPLDYGLPFEGLQSYGWIVTDEELVEVIHNGESLPKVRHAVLDELIFYNTESTLIDSRGTLPSNALSENQYLKLSQVLEVRSQISKYNQAIERVVSQSNGDLIMVDIHAYFEELFQGFDVFLEQPADGANLEGALFLPTIGKLGIFSADGINLNPRGNALLLNKVIEAMNIGFNGNLKLINPNDFAGTPTRLGGNR